MMSEFRRRLLISAAINIVGSNYIHFADKTIEKVCIKEFSSDGIGVTYEDAAKVTEFGDNLFLNKQAKSFEEIKYFSNLKTLSWGCFHNNDFISMIIPSTVYNLPTGNNAWYRFGLFGSCLYLKNISFLGDIKSLPYACFKDCVNLSYEGINGLDSLTEIGAEAFRNTAISKFVLPSTVTSINLAAMGSKIGKTFADCKNLTLFISNPINPPIAMDNTFENTPIQSIYVPDESVNKYKTAEGWKTYADKIKPLSEYVPQ